MVVGCSDGGTSTNTNGTADPSSGGGDSDTDAEEPTVVVPTGPGRDAAVCPAVTCQDWSIQSVWMLDQRCDQSGTWVDPQCSAATFAWTLTDATGSVSSSVGGTEILWDVATTTTWTIEYPSECGGCSEFESSGRLAGPFDSPSGMVTSAWSTLECADTGSGGCSCTGTLERQEFYDAQKTLRSGLWDLEMVEYGPTGTTSAIPASHFYRVCQGPEGMVMEDELGAYYYFTPAAGTP